MIHFLNLMEIVFVALLAAFLILLMQKTGVREWLQVNADYFIGKVIKSYDGSIFNQLFSCDFCTSWWICVFISVLWMLDQHDLEIILYPIFATPITKNLL